MAILPINTDYADKDFDSLRARLFALIRSVYPDWSVTATANFGNLLIESFAFVGDVVGFYQDQNAREAHWATVQLRKNAINLARLISYNLAPAVAASGDVTLAITNASALGATNGGTIINDEAYLALAASYDITNEALTMNSSSAYAIDIVGNSTNTWTGTFTFNADTWVRTETNCVVDLVGPIGGTGGVSSSSSSGSGARRHAPLQLKSSS